MTSAREAREWQAGGSIDPLSVEIPGQHQQRVDVAQRDIPQDGSVGHEEHVFGVPAVSLHEDSSPGRDDAKKPEGKRPAGHLGWRGEPRDQQVSPFLWMV